jgi:hypothetical protein
VTARLSLSDRVLDVQFANVAQARASWARLVDEIPPSRRKDQLDDAVRRGERLVIRETAMRLYIWLEGYEAARGEE